MGVLKGKLKSRVLAVGVNTVAALAFVLLALTSQRVAGYVVAGLAIGLLAWRARRSNFNDTAAPGVLAASGLLIDYHRTAADSGAAALVPIAIAGAGIILLLADQPITQFLMNRPKIGVAHLPGYRQTRDSAVSQTTLFRANVALVALLGVSALTEITAWPMAVLTLAVAATTLIAVVQVARRRSDGLGVDKRLRAALEAYDPQFAFYFTAPPRTEYHVSMWYPYLKRIGKPFVIILRESTSFKPIAAMVDVPVLLCEHEPFVDQAVLPSLKACFYANNGSKNSHMVRFSHLTHIQLLHGDSDKTSSFNPVTSMFDRIFVAGQAGIDRYAANGVMIPQQKFDIVGRPQVETIKVGTTKIADVQDKVVLYASTWVGYYANASYCSLHLGEQIVRKLLDRGNTVILRPHPYARRDLPTARRLVRIEAMLAEDRERTGRKHLFGAVAEKQMSLIDCFNASDALVSDVSSVASDWLFSEKPFAMANMLGEDRDQFEKGFPLARAAYLLDNKAGNLDDVLDDLLSADPLASVRRELKTYYLGDFPADSYSQGFVDAAAKYVSS